MAIRPLNADETKWFEKVRVKAVNNAPYLADLIYMLKPVMNEDEGTFAVDDKARLYLSREGWAGSWSDDETAWALIHECMHILRDHHRRRNNREPDAWNRACDLEINDDLTSMGRLMPPPGILKPSLYGFGNGYTAESYYKRLPKGGNQPRSMCSGASKESSESADMVEQGRTETEIESAQESAWISVQDEAKNGRSVGHGLAKFVAEKLNDEPKVNWVDVLASIVSRKISEIAAGNTDTSWRRANRRFDDPILPGKVGYNVDVAIVVDSSGSMGRNLVLEMLNEVEGILNAPGVTAKYLLADTEGTKLYDNVPHNVTLSGFGGTHMGQAVDEAVEKYGKDKVDLVIVLTDGMTPWEREFTGPVIAGIAGRLGTETPKESGVTSIMIPYD